MEVQIPNGVTAREKLVEVETPRVSGEENKAPRLAALENSQASASNATSTADASSKSATANGKQTAVIEEAMKTIEI